MYTTGIRVAPMLQADLLRWLRLYTTHILLVINCRRAAANDPPLRHHWLSLGRVYLKTARYARQQILEAR